MKGHQGSRSGAGPSRLRRRDRRAATSATIIIGDTTEDQVNINETIPEPVEETESAENADNTENWINEIRIADISTYTYAEAGDQATNLEDFASDKEKSASEKNPAVAKGEAAKASNTDTNL